jgi:Porin-like glycoporin RafY
MQHIFKLAAVAALCASAAAHAGVAFDANLETNTDFRKETATQDSITNGGRVEINAAAEAKNGDYFVKARGTMLVGLTGGGVGIDDAWVQVGSSSVDLKVGRFEAMDLFPLGKDVAANIGNVGYNANTLRGRKTDGRLHAALGMNASSAVRFELGLVTEKQAGGATYGLRPVVQFNTGALTVRAGVESIKADGGGASSTGLGLTAGYAMDSSTTINANFASNSKQDTSAFGLNATFGDAGVGFIQGKNKATNIKSTSVYAAYTFSLLGIKGASVTPALGFYKETGKSNDTAFRVRINYAF